MIREINGINIRNYNYDDGSVSHTGSTTETKLMSVLIPANTFKAGDLITMEVVFGKSGTAASYTYKFYWHTSDALGGTQLTTRGIGSANTFATATRRMSVRTANGGGSAPEVGTEMITTTGALASEYQSNTVSNVALNWTVDSYLMASVTLGSAADTVTQYALKIWTY